MALTHCGVLAKAVFSARRKNGPVAEEHPVVSARLGARSFG